MGRALYRAALQPLPLTGGHLTRLNKVKHFIRDHSLQVEDWQMY